MKKTLLILASFLLLGLGAFAQLTFESNNCEGEYLYQYTLNREDSIRWSLVAGAAEFTQGDDFLSVTKAAAGTILKQSIWYPNNSSVISEYYTINLPDDCSNGKEYDLSTTDQVNVKPCDFPVAFKGQKIFLQTQTAEWLAIDGDIQFSGQGTTIASVNDLDDLSGNKHRLVYLIKERAAIVYSDTVSILFLPTKEGTQGDCVGIDQGQNAGVIDCNTEYPLLPLVNGSTEMNNNLKYVWSSSSEGVTIQSPNSYSTSFTASTSGLKVVKLDVYTLPFENRIGSSESTFSVNCTQDDPTTDCIDESKIRYDYACATFHEPVCGCDGQVYSNACEAEAAGVVSYETGGCSQQLPNNEKIMGLIEGEWLLKNYTGGFCGCTTLPNGTSKYIFERIPNTEDGVSYQYFSNNTLVESGETKVSYSSFLGNSGWFLEEIAFDNTAKFYFSDDGEILSLDYPQIADAPVENYERFKEGQAFEKASTIKQCDFPVEAAFDKTQSFRYEYEVKSGTVDFTYTPGASCVINNATDGAVLVERRYDYVNTLLTVNVTNLTINVSTCEDQTYDVSIDPGKNEGLIECGQESFWIFAEVNEERTSPTDEYLYTWSTEDEGINLIFSDLPNTLYTIDTPGKKTILLEVFSKSGDLLGTSEITVNSNCKETQDEVFEIDNCQYPFYHQYATPEPSDRVFWEVETGFADIEERDNVLTINDATDGTILLKKVYYNGNFTVTPYEINITGACEVERYTLDGYVNAGDQRWNDGMIYLYSTDKEKAVDSVQFENGTYSFSNILEGGYTLYAVPYSDNTLEKEASMYVPTYYVNKMNLEDANVFEVAGNTFGLDLQLVKATVASVIGSKSIRAITYPNPFFDRLTIETETMGATFTVSNTQGAIIYSGLAEQLTTINTANWEKGIYFIEVKTQSNTEVFKVLK